ncbi:MAG: hypothetical protein JW751_14630 [Polyangiaceae bacterium]|nr:hypothetical protein [Polyangiaceae bacterium]
MSRAWSLWGGVLHEVNMRSSPLSLTAFAAALALSTTACVENESSLFLRGVVAITSEDCSATADPASAMLANGVLDTGLTSTYTAALLVGNQLVARGSADQLRTETARIALRGAEVRLETTTQQRLREFSVDGTGFVDPANGTSPGYGIFWATLVPSLTGVRPPTTVLANVRVYGRTLGGREVESGELAFPIVVCTRCLVSFPPEALDGDGECTVPSSDETELPCLLGQDQAVDCRACTATHTACRRP